MNGTARFSSPLPASTGPWLPGTQSGPAVAALLAALCESAVETAEMVAVSLHFEFLRPVPLQSFVAPVLTLLRRGRHVEVIHVCLAVGQIDCVVATLVSAP